MRTQFKFYQKNKLYRVLMIVIIITSFTSCISTNKVAFVDNKEKLEGRYTTASWSYKIQKGDRFHISIIDPLSSISFGTAEISNTASQAQANFFLQQPTINDYVVQLDGTVNLPVIGNVKIEGVELDSLPYFLTQECKGYISNPNIQVFMMNYNVTVLGEVRLPGFFQVITHHPTFFDAIGLAGDLTDFANRSEVQIQRKKANGSVEVVYVDVLDPSFISSPYYFLYPNDVIHVRPLKVKQLSNGNAVPLILSTITTILTIFTIVRTN